MATQLIEGRPGGRRQYPHHDVGSGVELIQLVAQQMAQTATHRVADYRVAHSSRDDETRSRPPRSLRGIRGAQVYHETIARGASPAPDHSGEVVRPP
jgi:hypothetical protein